LVDILAVRGEGEILGVKAFVKAVKIPVGIWRLNDTDPCFFNHGADASQIGPGVSEFFFSGVKGRCKWKVEIVVA